MHLERCSHPEAYQERLKLAAEDVRINISSVCMSAKAFDISHWTLNRCLSVDTANVRKVGLRLASGEEEGQLNAAAFVDSARNETLLS